MTTPYKNMRASYGEYEGKIVKLANDRATELIRAIWWVPDANTEKTYMFTHRNDNGGVWRLFPGPADGPTLQLGSQSGTRKNADLPGYAPKVRPKLITRKS